MSKAEQRSFFENLNFEERQNLVGFYALLLKIDKRVNPQLYKNKSNENYDNNRNTDIAHKAE